MPGGGIRYMGLRREPDYMPKRRFGWSGSICNWHWQLLPVELRRTAVPLITSQPPRQCQSRPAAARIGGA
jgi:hypothetical protein